MVAIISIHASRGGSDHPGVVCNPDGNISIHASRGGSDLYAGAAPGGAHISIHASRKGSDAEAMIPAGAIKRFQSTLPAREATSGSGQIMCPGRISIHASCKGSDHSAGWCRYPGQYFNPRFPRGKRPPGLPYRRACSHFNPHFPRGKRPL